MSTANSYLPCIQAYSIDFGLSDYLNKQVPFADEPVGSRTRMFHKTLTGMMTQMHSLDCKAARRNHRYDNMVTALELAKDRCLRFRKSTRAIKQLVSTTKLQESECQKILVVLAAIWMVEIMMEQTMTV